MWLLLDIFSFRYYLWEDEDFAPIFPSSWAPPIHPFTLPAYPHPASVVNVVILSSSMSRQCYAL